MIHLSTPMEAADNPVSVTIGIEKSHSPLKKPA
jgi:hypothetical protein